MNLAEAIRTADAVLDAHDADDDIALKAVRRKLADDPRRA